MKANAKETIKTKVTLKLSGQEAALIRDILGATYGDSEVLEHMHYELDCLFIEDDHGHTIKTVAGKMTVTPKAN